MNIIKEPLECYFVKFKFTNHIKHKKILLSLIEISDCENPKNDQAELNITRTDWFDCKNLNRKWFQYFKLDFSKNLEALFLKLGYSGYTINEIWFQQYLTGSEHGWHVHSSNFTGVYYLELPNDSPKTKIIEPYSNKEIILDVEEGDIIIFPSFTIHKAPKNMSNKRKSIISFNVDALLKGNSFYNKKFLQ